MMRYTKRELRLMEKYRDYPAMTIEDMEKREKEDRGTIVSRLYMLFLKTIIGIIALIAGTIYIFGGCICAFCSASWQRNRTQWYYGTGRYSR